MNRLKSYFAAALDWSSSVPLWCWALLALGIVCLCSLPTGSSAAPAPVPPDMLSAIRAEIETVNGSVVTVDKSLQAQTAALGEIKQLLTEIRDQHSSGRRSRSTADGSSVPVPDTPSTSITLPSGESIELLALASKATGRFTVEGDHYRASLIGHGFEQSQLPADEGTCRLVYDGWKSSQAPPVQLQSSNRSQPPLRWQCNGKSCRLIR